MNSAVLHKYRLITSSGEITSGKGYKNLIINVHNFIMGNNTQNVKFIMFYADAINSITMFKRILQKI